MLDRVVQARPVLALDVATGTGAVARRLAATTGAPVVGIDLSEPMLREAVRAARRPTGPPMVFAVARAEQLPFVDACFDALTFTYLLRYVADPAATMAELARVVKPGAPVSSLDFAVPDHPLWRVAWWCYTRLVLPVAGLVTGGRAWFDVGRFLGPSIEGFEARHPPAAVDAAWRAAGFADVSHRRMSLGGGIVRWGRRT
jgi:demethylmenaquinone methyltransferase/2-methoxy-6-polyprenyl-1,4-benzoquinol methylase